MNPSFKLKFLIELEFFWHDWERFPFGSHVS
jgi:hypothetical protein